MILVTGAAGFIGSHVLRALGKDAIGIDNFNDYYNPQLKRDRAEGLPVYELDIEDDGAVRLFLKKHRPEAIVHLAAQAGVAYSEVNPMAYVRSNVTGTMNLLRYNTGRFVFASSSSVYGRNPAPWKEDMPVDPRSLYAASKVFGEHLVRQVPSHAILRFFTVYGPWGRPDMSMWIFARCAMNRHPLILNGEGKIQRDYTYIDDVVEQVIRSLEHRESFTMNVGGGTPYEIGDVASRIIKELDVVAHVMMPKEIPSWDLPLTCADTAAQSYFTNYIPRVDIRDGISRFVRWFAEKGHAY